MGLFDIFRKKKPDDGTYHREAGSSAGDYYNTGVSCGDYGVFRITVQDVFSITGRGTVITGQIESGSITVGDTVTLRRRGGSSREVVVAGLEMFRKMLDTIHHKLVMGGDKDEDGFRVQAMCVPA